MDNAFDAGLAGLAAHFSNGGDPVAVIEGCFTRIGQQLADGAFVDLDTSRARSAAQASQARWAAGNPLSPLDGIPIAVKSNVAVAGLPCTAGIAAYRGNIANIDAPVVAAYRRAGAVILGTVAMHEGAFGATSDNISYGRCQNPWRHGYTPGGSSGGSAAAVAAGLCAGAIGTDTMGSVRLPSSYCGVFGHKPGFDTIPTEDVIPLSWTLDHVGVHGRSAMDCAALLAPFRDIQPRRPKRVAAIRADTMTLTDEVATGYAQTLERARAFGIDVLDIDLPLGGESVRRAGLLIVEAEAAAAHAAMLAADPEGFTPEFREAMAWACRQPIPKLALAHRTLIETRRTLQAAWGMFDAILLPTTPQTAFPFDGPVPPSQADLTVFANVLGCPATAFPVGLSPDGLPVSVQALGWTDEATLGLAESLALPVGWPPA